MSITIHLNAEVKRRLRGQAAKDGLTLEEYIKQLAERAAVSNSAGSSAISEAWETAWRAWAAGHIILPSAANDDRDAIYAGRGE